MKMKIKILIPICISLLFFSSVLSARGQQNKAMAPGNRMQAMLELTDEQADKIETIHLKASKSTIPIMSQMKVKQAELDQLMLADKPNRNTIIKKVQELEALKSELKVMNTLKRLDVRDLLTEEQRVKFDQMHLSRGFGHHNMGRPMHQGMRPQGGQHRKPGMGRPRQFNRFDDQIEDEG